MMPDSQHLPKYLFLPTLCRFFARSRDITHHLTFSMYPASKAGTESTHCHSSLPHGLSMHVAVRLFVSYIQLNHRFAVHRFGYYPAAHNPTTDRQSTGVELKLAKTCLKSFAFFMVVGSDDAMSTRGQSLQILDGSLNDITLQPGVLRHALMQFIVVFSLLVVM